MKNSSPFAYLRKRNAKATRKKLGASNGSGSDASRFLHLNNPQRSAATAGTAHNDLSPGQRLLAAHQKRVAAKDYSSSSQSTHQVTAPSSATKGGLTPGQRLVAAHLRQQEAKATSGSVQASDASPGERMVALVNRHRGS